MQREPGHTPRGQGAARQCNPRPPKTVVLEGLELQWEPGDTTGGQGAARQREPGDTLRGQEAARQCNPRPPKTGARRHAGRPMELVSRVA